MRHFSLVGLASLVGALCVSGCDDDEATVDGGRADASVRRDAGDAATSRTDGGAAIGRLDPSTLTPFVAALPIPASVQGFEENLTTRSVVMGMWEIEQELHPELEPTRVWAYGTSRAAASYPGPTIEARTGAPLEIEWQNNLPPNHFLPIDTTIHWADPPDFPGAGVPVVVHVHGGLQAPPSDGHPDAWFTPGFAQTGPGFVQRTYRYENQNDSETLWYHDHALGLTRLNVYAGLAGFYILRDPQLDATLELPSGAYEVPLLIQDRAFNEDGSLFYPSEGVNPDVHPVWVPEFFGDVNLVNGAVWPYVEVEPRKYRFRILNGANARFYELRMSDGRAFTVIGTDGGYVEAPVTVSSILLGPSERADVIVDFSDLAPGATLELQNAAAAPYPMGDAVDESTARVMQLRVVPLTAPDESRIPPALADIPDLAAGGVDAVRPHTLFEEEDPETGDPLGVFLDGRHWGPPGSVTDLPRVGSTEVWEIINLTDDAHPIHLHLIDFQIVDRQPFDADAYLAEYEALNPTLPSDNVVTPPVAPFLQGEPVPPLDYERGWKDTVRAMPGQVTRIIVRWAPERGLPFPFDPTAEPGYVWHCHILEHEDNEMMRRLQLVE